MDTLDPKKCHKNTHVKKTSQQTEVSLKTQSGSTVIYYCAQCFINLMTNIFTTRIRRMREGNSFSLFVSPHPGGGTPSPSHSTSIVPMSFLGVPPSQVRTVGGGGFTPGQVTHPHLGCIPPKMGSPLVRTTQGVLAARWAVCLLCSRVRIFLFTFK